MNGRFDKIAPGLAAKLNFFFDEAFGVLSLLLAIATDPPWVFDSRVGLLSLVAALSWFVAAAILRLYSPCSPRTKADSALLSIVAVAGTTAAVALAELWLWPDGGPISLIFFATVFASASIASRLLWLAFFHRMDRPLDDVLIVGTGRLAAATYRRLTAGPLERRRVVGLVRLRGEPARPWHGVAPVLGDAGDLLGILSEHPVAEVYIAAPVLKHGAQVQKVVRICERVGMPFALPCTPFRFERAALLGADNCPDGYLHYLSTRASPGQYAIKRLIDIVASAAALVVLSPLLVVVALAIKLTSEGPVLFKQRRVGLHGATFNLFKFRSMVANAEALRGQLLEKNEQSGPVFKMRNDPRITPIGRFIRRYSIDELPQVINVLRGDMTLVGPRPALPSEVAVYQAWQRRRLSVRPGLTCYWQVGGRNEIGFEDWMRLDLRYVDNWSLAVDFRLILQTVPVVLAGKGAS